MSEVLTTGLTGCSSPVEVGALPLRLEWLELVAWCCRTEEEARQRQPRPWICCILFTVLPLSLKSVWFLSISMWASIPPTFLVSRTVWRTKSDSPCGRRAARQLWPQKSECCFWARRGTAGTLQARVVGAMRAGYCCGTWWTRPPWWSPSSRRWDRWDSSRRMYCKPKISLIVYKVYFLKC